MLQLHLVLRSLTVAKLSVAIKTFVCCFHLLTFACYCARRLDKRHWVRILAC